MNHQAVQDSGKCPVCRGTGWELYDAGEIPEYGSAHPYARKCTACMVPRHSTDRTGVPTQFCEADLSKFRFDTYRTDMDKCKKVILGYFDKFKEFQGKGIYLWSNTPGSGKTFLACCLANSIMLRNDLRMRFVTAPDYLSIVGDSYKRQAGERDESQIYRECDLLIFDDIGSQKKGEWQEQEIFRLVNERQNAEKVTIYTSNMPPEKLNIDSRAIDRIIKNSIVIPMPEESIRSRLAAEEQEALLQRLLSE